MKPAIVWDMAEQGSEAWLAARKGIVTGSMAKYARMRLKNGELAKAALDYARDLARERCGGTPAPVFVNAAMRTGQDQEPVARMRYEARTGEIVEEVGFCHTSDRRFGASVDGLVFPPGGVEIKTLVASDSLFTAAVGGDVSAYRDQCLMAMWLLGLQWMDIVLWCPDLDLLRIIRIDRDEAEIEAFAADMQAFESVVQGLANDLAAIMKATTDAGMWTELDAEPDAPEPVETVDMLHALTMDELNPAPARTAVGPDAIPESF